MNEEVQITVSREDATEGRLPYCKVELDGGVIGLVGAGMAATFAIKPGNHSLVFEMGQRRSGVKVFDAKAEERLSFEIRADDFPKPMENSRVRATAGSEPVELAALTETSQTGVLEDLIDFVGRLVWGVLLGAVLAIGSYILSFLLAWMYLPGDRTVGAEESFGYMGWMHLMGIVGGWTSFCFGVGMAFTGSSKDFKAAFRLLLLFFIGIHLVNAGYVWWHALTRR